MRADLAQFQEVEQEGNFVLQNSKLLKVRLAQGQIQAKLGSMVAYQGQVGFEHAGSGGLGRMMKKMTTGEGQKLMNITGSGEIFLADQAQDIHLLYLEDEEITVNGANLLAFDADIDWDIKKVSGGMAGMLAGGLFNTTLQGRGFVAVLSDGPPVLLDISQAETFADAQAAITWSAGVQTAIKTDVSAKTFFGRGSGESLQVAFSGSGWVLVQPSEGRPLPTASSTGSGGSGISFG